MLGETNLSILIGARLTALSESCFWCLMPSASLRLLVLSSKQQLGLKAEITLALFTLLLYTAGDKEPQGCC